MAIDGETRATIVRLSRAEGWAVGTMAKHPGAHHGTVKRPLRAGRSAGPGRGPSTLSCRSSGSGSGRRPTCRPARSGGRSGRWATAAARTTSATACGTSGRGLPSGRAVDAAHLPSGRAGAGRPGRLRQGPHRPRRAQPDGAPRDPQPLTPGKWSGSRFAGPV